MARILRCLVFTLCLQVNGISLLAGNSLILEQGVKYKTEQDRPLIVIKPYRYVSGSNDCWDVYFFAEFVNDLLQFVTTNDGYQAKYEIIIEIMDANGNSAISEINKGNVSVINFTDTNARNIVTRYSFLFRMESGIYEIFTEVIDEETGRHFTQSYPLVLTLLDKGLVISDFAVIDSLKFEFAHPASAKVNLLQTYYSPGSRFVGYFELFSIKEDTVDLNYRIYDQSGNRIAGHRETVFLKAGCLKKLIPLKELIVLPGVYWVIIEVRNKVKKLSLREQFDISHWEPSSSVEQIVLSDNGISAFKHIFSEDEYNRLLLASQGERVALLDTFWTKRDPIPETDVNELRQEFGCRLDFVFRKYSNALIDRTGWDTDRGKVYVIYGPPTEIKQQYLSQSSRRYEIWYYKNLDKQFVFLDKSGYGLFHLIHTD